MRKNKQDTKTEKILRKEKRITTRLNRSIALILFLAVVIPVIVYNNVPEWGFYLVSATRLYIAAQEIDDSYGKEHFAATLQETEKRYDSTIEVYSADDRLIYSTVALTKQLPADLETAPSVPDEYKLDYKVTSGKVNAGSKGFLIKCFDNGNIQVDFLDCYYYTTGGERVEICMQISQVATTAKIDFMIFFVIVMIALTLAMLTMRAYIRRFTKPINRIVDITDSLAKLDFAEECPRTKLVELNKLSDSINTMSASLNAALMDLQERNKKLETDIENERTIDALRKTFIGGISHEMKTPIAIIQGYAEGAKMFYDAGKKETADKYCDTVIEETRRMNKMIMSLLEITRYDSGDYEPNKEPFSIKAPIDDWLERNGEMLKEKGITAINYIPESLYGNGDAAILASVVNNYLSNACSHADGDKRIELWAEDSGDSYRVKCFNTGNNIEDKDIDKIWTSFYRADKSLSRSQGRFGLGLAIVASIQKIHGREYGVYNTSDGVIFWFDIEKGDKQNEQNSNT